MKYCDLRPAFEAYKRGENVTETLREMLKETNNNDQIIEIAYDLQAGTYIDGVKKDKEAWQSYSQELAEILKCHIKSGDRILDAGTGELTTLAGITQHLNLENIHYYACDISWSRIHKGSIFINDLIENLKLSAFVANFFHLPLRDKSIDVIFTSHALEPNGGRETEIITELLRVTKKLILFEPSFEHNSLEGQDRMRRHGYVSDLPKAIIAAGGILDELIKIETTGNLLNPTYAHVITPAAQAKVEDYKNESLWACPSTKLGMKEQAGFYMCLNSGLAYPILQGIPILRPESAILATALT